MQSKTQKLHAAIAAAAPIHGVSVGRWDDKKTWRVDYRVGASRAQRSGAQAVIDAFNSDAIPAPSAAERVEEFCTNNGFTLAELRATISARD